MLRYILFKDCSDCCGENGLNGGEYNIERPVGACGHSGLGPELNARDRNEQIGI